MALWRGLVLLLVMGVLAACATGSSPPSIAQVVDLSRQGVPPERIIATMKQSDAVYQIDATQSAQLKREGVSDSVIDYMQQTSFNQPRRTQWRQDRSGGYPGYYSYGWGGWKPNGSWY